MIMYARFHSAYPPKEQRGEREEEEEAGIGEEKEEAGIGK
jgi:hypothetical protein